MLVRGRVPVAGPGVHGVGQVVLHAVLSLGGGVASVRVAVGSRSDVILRVVIILALRVNWGPVVNPPKWVIEEGGARHAFPGPRCVSEKIVQIPVITKSIIFDNIKF